MPMITTNMRSHQPLHPFTQVTILARPSYQVKMIGHLVLWPQDDGDLGRFMQRLTITHVTRWQKYYNMVGYGHLYQGRFQLRRTTIFTKSIVTLSETLCVPTWFPRRNNGNGEVFGFASLDLLNIEQCLPDGPFLNRASGYNM